VTVDVSMDKGSAISDDDMQLAETVAERVCDGARAFIARNLREIVGCEEDEALMICVDARVLLRLSIDFMRDNEDVAVARLRHQVADELRKLADGIGD